MSSARRIGLALILGSLSGACATSSAAGNSTTADSAQGGGDDQAATELQEHHRHHNHGGISQFIAMSLDTLGTDEAKRPQIEKIQGDLHRCMAPAHAAEKGLLNTIADGVAAGAIDSAKVDATIAQIDSAAAAAHSCSFDALNQLHAILSPEERQALVEKVQAHWAVWRKVNHEAEVGGKEHGGRLDALATELTLTPQQVEDISAKLHAGHDRVAGKFDKSKAEAHMMAFSTAFASDTFDAKQVTENANGGMAAHGSRRMARFYEIVVPILTPEQRTTLVDHLRAHASHQPTAA